MKFIFHVKIKPGHTAEEYAKVWIRASEIIQSKPGARGTRLHRTIGDPNTLLAIAEWDSKEARDAAMAELDDDDRMRPFSAQHREIGEFVYVGQYEDAEWTVMP